MTIPYNPYEFILGSTPNIPRGRFVYTSGTFKQLVQLSIDDAPGAPFDVIIGGTRSFQNNDNTLKLDDIDLGSRNSGFVSVKMKEGFQGLFFLTTENNDFFDDNALTGIRGDWTSENEIATDDLAGNWPTVWYQADTDGGLSRTMFGLDEGDYVSIDVDSESSRVAQMRVRIGGVDYYNNREINDETYLSMLWVRQWLPDYENTGFTPIDPEPDPDPTPTPTVECPVGFEDNGFGICVPI
ncbi:MAG: hypothetical protein CMF11_04975, partial [Idiomarina sp.]|nr:hypothetical protein [Idiomarina sp.]